MSPEALKALLSCLGSTVAPVQTRKGRLVASCPFAPWQHDGGKDTNPSFAFELSAGNRYHCFSCNESDDPMGRVQSIALLNRKQPIPGLDLAQALKIVVDEPEEALTIPDYDTKTAPVVEKVQPWPEWFLECFKPALVFDAARAYLRTRQITTEVVKQLDLRYDSYRKRVCFPIRDWEGRLVGLHGRHLNRAVTFYDYGEGGDKAHAALSKHLPAPMQHVVPPQAAGDPGNMAAQQVNDVLSAYLHMEIPDY